MSDSFKLQFEKVRRPKIVSDFGKLILLATGTLMVIGYIVWQAWALLGPPRVSITSPINGVHTNQSYVDFSGAAASGTSLSVNGDTIPLEPDGTFSQKVPLKPGGNRLYIRSANRAGRTQDKIIIVYSDLT